MAARGLGTRLVTRPRSYIPTYIHKTASLRAGQKKLEKLLVTRAKKKRKEVGPMYLNQVDVRLDLIGSGMCSK